jgi:tetratricopeptide (TPR) repeat protein
LFVGVVGGVGHARDWGPAGKTLLGCLAGALLLACAVLTWIQVGYWRNSATLWQRSLRVTEGNYEAHCCYGAYLAQQGRLPEALEHFEQAVAIKPYHLRSRNQLGLAYQLAGRTEEARQQYLAILAIDDRFGYAKVNLGRLLAREGKLDEAIAYYESALAQDPKGDFAHHLGVALGRKNDAASWSRARAAHEQSVRDRPRQAIYRGYLAWIQHRLGDPAAAEAEYRRALAADPDWLAKARQQAWVMATHPDAPLRDGAAAVELAEQVCQATGERRAEHLDVLAAALAENRQYAAAAQTAEEAREKAQQQGQTGLAAEILDRLERYYRQGKPYRMPREE